MTPPAVESLPRRNSDPIWLQDYFVQTGHDADTRSGTSTFVKRKGIHYVCTCRHIMEGIKDPKVVPNAKFPTLALAIEKAFINLSRMTAADYRNSSCERLDRTPSMARPTLRLRRLIQVLAPVGDKQEQERNRSGSLERAGLVKGSLRTCERLSRRTQKECFGEFDRPSR